jgi:DNA polymerase-3 subunit epsilon
LIAFSGTAWEDIWQTLETREYVVLDTETTGLDAPEIVSVAVIDSHRRTLINEFVHPAKPIEPGASRITGITDEMVHDRAEFPTIYQALFEALDGRLVTIYNADYDLRVLRNTCNRYNLDMPKFESWCVMEWFARVYGKWDRYRADYSWQKLSAAAKYFRVEQTDAHDALGDCLTTQRIIEAGLDRARKLRPNMDPLL